LNPNRESPKYQGLYICYSRNAILRCLGWKPKGGEDFFEFEYVLSMSQFASNRKPEGYLEKIHRDNLTPLSEINEMEALAYASR